jgi:hypothetical protein
MSEDVAAEAADALNAIGRPTMATATTAAVILVFDIWCHLRGLEFLISRFRLELR